MPIDRSFSFDSAQYNGRVARRCRSAMSDRRQAGLDAQEARHLRGEREPGGRSRVHAVIQPGGGLHFDQLSGRARHVRHVRRSDDAIFEDLRLGAGGQRFLDPGGAAFRRAAAGRLAEDAFDAQDVGAGCVLGKPLPQQLRCRHRRSGDSAGRSRGTAWSRVHRTRSRCCSGPAPRRGPWPTAPAPAPRRRCCSTPRSADPRRRRRR